MTLDYAMCIKESNLGDARGNYVLRFTAGLATPDGYSALSGFSYKHQYYYDNVSLSIGAGKSVMFEGYIARSRIRYYVAVNSAAAVNAGGFSWYCSLKPNN